MRHCIAVVGSLLLVTGVAHSQFMGGQIGAHYGGHGAGVASRPARAWAGFRNGGRHTRFAQRPGATVRGRHGNLWSGGQIGPAAGNQIGPSAGNMIGPSAGNRIGPSAGNAIGVNYGTGPYGSSRGYYSRLSHTFLYGAPFYYGGWGYEQQPRQVAVRNNPPRQSSVIINQYYSTPEAKPVVHEYAQGQLPEPEGMRADHAPAPSLPDPADDGTVANADRADDEPTIYLIAFKDQSIYPAVGYWIEGDTLHYITMQGAHRRASLDLVDREFSERLNRERNVEFHLEIPPGLK